METMRLTRELCRHFRADGEALRGLGCDWGMVERVPLEYVVLHFRSNGAHLDR